MDWKAADRVQLEYMDKQKGEFLDPRLEELYQAFKARLLEEMESEGK